MSYLPETNKLNCCYIILILESAFRNKIIEQLYTAIIHIVYNYEHS